MTIPHAFLSASALAVALTLAAAPSHAQTTSPPSAGVQPSPVAPKGDGEGGASFGTTREGQDQTGSVTSAPKRGMDPACADVLKNQASHSKAEIARCGQQQE